ncbi:MAG: hypothetical protein EB082_03420 [Verrucomicrobia bacterium]|nr:hypothetical protein [Verrucomicrobiota bacterium]
MLSLFLLLAFSAHAQSLRLPPRPADSLAGRAVAESVTTLERPAREERLVAEVLRGNVPDFLRRLVPVSLTNTVEGTTHRVTVFVAPDYLAVGSDADYFLGPLTPGAARRIADATGCLLPSRKLVDAIHAAAPLKLNPQPIPPSKEMVTVPVFARHNEMVWEQRRAALAAHPLGTLEAASTGEWRPSPHFGELVMDFKLEPGVRVHVNAPARTALAARKPTHLILYALPNGNTVEQTVGKRLAPGDDWHFNLQHIGAQTRWLREHETNATVVVAYFEAAGLSWPAWKRTNGVAKIPGYVERVAALFPNQKLTLTLNGHSGGGSFIFGFMDAHERIPASVERIAFLDSNYGYDDAKRHADKLLAWLNASPRNHLCMLAYHDSNALLNGKTFVSEEGGTWGRSHAMLAHFKRGLTFESATKDGLQTHSALVGRVKFLLKENPERKILHTVQVERNGFIHSMLTGTPAESRGYEYLGERAYEGLIQP